ncbi:MAG: GC-type dockerin domain-anchored protein [Phycisphaerales bacterium]
MSKTTFGVSAIGALALVCGASMGQPRVMYSNIQTDLTSLIPGTGGLHFKSAASGGIFSEPAASRNGQIWCFVAKIDAVATSADEVFIVGAGGSGTAVLQEGSALATPGALAGENLGIFRGYGINDSGLWAIANNTSAATTQDEIIIRGGDFDGIRVALREGDPHPAYPGETIGALLDAVAVLQDGTLCYWNSAVSGTTGTTAKQGWFKGIVALTKADDAALQPTGQQFAPDQTWDNFSNSFRITPDGSHWSGLGDLNGATANDNVAVFDNVVLLQEGGQLPGVTGGSPIQGASAAQTMIRCGGRGHWMARGTTADGIGYLIVDGVIVAREGDNVLGDAAEQYAGVGTSVNSSDPTGFRGIAMNNLGDWVVNANTNEANGGNGVVILNNARVVVRKGATLAGVDVTLGPAKLGRIGDTNIGDDMALTDDGRLYFTGEITGGATGGVASSGMMVLRVFCGIADVGTLGGTAGRDNQLTADDIVVYLAAFFSGNLAVADLAALGGVGGPDGELTPDDLVIFLGAFFAGCP